MIPRFGGICTKETLGGRCFDVLNLWGFWIGALPVLCLRRFPSSLAVLLISFGFVGYILTINQFTINVDKGEKYDSAFLFDILYLHCVFFDESPHLAAFFLICRHVWSADDVFFSYAAAAARSRMVSIFLCVVVGPANVYAYIWSHQWCRIFINQTLLLQDEWCLKKMIDTGRAAEISYTLLKRSKIKW